MHIPSRKHKQGKGIPSSSEVLPFYLVSESPSSDISTYLSLDAPQAGEMEYFSWVYCHPEQNGVALIRTEEGTDSVQVFSNIHPGYHYFN